MYIYIGESILDMVDPQKHCNFSVLRKATFLKVAKGALQKVQSDNAAKNLNLGWLRLVGSLKLYVSFAKVPYERDYILQKRPIILRSLLIVATAYPVRGHKTR